MSTFDKRSPGWIKDLRDAGPPDGGPGMSSDQVDIAIALIQMLHNGDPDIWRIDTCDEIIARFATELATNGTQNIENIMIFMANQANAPIATGTVLQVEWYRKLLLKLLLGGIAFSTLQIYAPGVIGFALDSAYSLLLTLRSGGVSDEEILTAVTSPSPFSAGPFAAAAARAGYNLVNLAFSVCGTIAGECARLGLLAGAQVVGQIPDCLKFGTELLGLALVTTAATSAAKGVTDVANSAYGVATGSADQIIAKWFDSGGRQRLQSAINYALVNGLDATKKAIETAFHDMDQINANFSEVVPGWAPNRSVGPTIKDIINNVLSVRLREAATEYGTVLGQLVSRLSEIEFGSDPSSDANNKVILQIAQDYGTSWSNPSFKALITLWRLSMTGILLPRTLSVSSIIGKQSLGNVKRANTIDNSSMFRPDPNDENRTIFSQKRPLGPNLPFLAEDAAKSTVVSQIPMLEDDSELAILINQDPEVQEAFRKSGNYKKACSLSYNDQEYLVDQIRTTATIPGQPETNTDAYTATIQRVLDEKVGEVLSEAKRLKSVDENAGGRPRKSRRHKKRRSTLKRRRMKRRRTRKGKKRRHTKKR